MVSCLTIVSYPKSEIAKQTMNESVFLSMLWSRLCVFFCIFYTHKTVLFYLSKLVIWVIVGLVNHSLIRSFIRSFVHICLFGQPFVVTCKISLMWTVCCCKFLFDFFFFCFCFCFFFFFFIYFYCFCCCLCLFNSLVKVSWNHSGFLFYLSCFYKFSECVCLIMADLRLEDN